MRSTLPLHVLPSIEPLESRIAPALIVSANGLYATWTDVDGDLVTLKVSKPVLDLGDFVYGPSHLGESVETLLLGDDGVQGLDITITAKPQDVNADGRKEGDGLVNIGRINALTVALGKVSLAGDLGEVDAGTGVGTALVSLTVASLGERGFDTGAPDLESTLDGALGALVVKGNLRGAYVNVFGAIGSVFIGGSLIGGSTTDSGRIDSGATLGPVTIGGDVVGGSGFDSGYIGATTKISSITIGGSFIGGSGTSAGYIYTGGSMGPVKIGGDLRGGSGSSSAYLNVAGSLASLTIGGSFVGGSGSGSGYVATNGKLGPVKIGGDLSGGSGASGGYLNARTDIDSVSIGGSFVGGFGAGSGYIAANGKVGPVKIGHDFRGGVGPSSAYLNVAGSVASVSIGGSFSGGSGGSSGTIYSSGKLGPVAIGGDLLGGSSGSDGSIEGGTGISSLTIRGSLVGGPADFAGRVVTNGTLGPVKIGGDLRGGDAGATNRTDTGSIFAKRITSLTIGGSIVAGHESGAGQLTRSGSVHATDDLGPIVVKGSLVGNPGNLVRITARGQATPSGGVDVALQSLTVGGRVEWTDVALGYSPTLKGQNADAQSGPISVGGDWIASNISAGVNPTNGYLGDLSDALLLSGFDYGGGPTKDTASVVSKIASIAIKGGVFGSSGGLPDLAHFGFVAEQIGSFTSNGTAVPLKAGAKNDTYALFSEHAVGSGFSTADVDGFEVHVIEV